MLASRRRDSRSQIKTFFHRVKTLPKCEKYKAQIRVPLFADGILEVRDPPSAFLPAKPDCKSEERGEEKQE